MNGTIFAPGARLLIRDEEWLVKTALPTNTGGTAVRVIGLSELVRNHEAIFLTELDKITELKPEDTKLVSDDSPQYRRSRLYIESLLRRTPPTDDRIYLGDKAAIDYAPYQVQPASLALRALRPRILIADGVGLGKTIEAGILLSELIKRGRGERILVVAIRSMLAQFQQEIWTRFSIPLVRLDSIGLQRVRGRIPANKNPFYYYDRAIISIDTLKNDAQYRHYLEQCHWDVIVIDECQNVANTGSERNRLAALLAHTCDCLIMTSATPHNGRPESFANLMNMLEPTAIADSTNYTSEDISGLFVRRFKKDIEDQVRGQFSERTVFIKKIEASPEEEAFFNRLEASNFHTLNRGWSNDALYRIGLLKGFLSSPIACLQTINGRIHRVQKRLDRLEGRISAEELAVGENEEEDLSAFQPELFKDQDKKQRLASDLHDDMITLHELEILVDKVDKHYFKKYGLLLDILRELNAVGFPDSPRVIIFSERIATLQFLYDNLKNAFSLTDEEIVQFHAGLPDIEQQKIVDDFGKEDSQLRILLASDVASEGVNLHFYCHLMIHFDIPWSLITLEQRNGRIDRFGQNIPPQVYYLLTVSKNEQIQGDIRVLNKLIEKEQEAHKNIGDAATILGLYDALKEEEKITQDIARGLSPEEVFAVTQPEQDWLAMLMGEANPPADENALGYLSHLYKDDLEFAKVAFDELALKSNDFVLPEFHPSRPEFTLLAPEDLRRRFEFVPQEARPENWNFRLSTDRKRVMKAIAEARKRKGEWPQEQLFWELHPVMEWLVDKLLVGFGRHEAPVILTQHIQSEQPIFLFQGMLSNRRSQPVISEWFGVQSVDAKDWKILPLEQVFEQTGFLSGLANLGKVSEQLDLLKQLLPNAVDHAREHMDKLRLARGQELGRRLRDDQRKLKKWYDAAMYRLAAEEMNARGSQVQRVYHERKEIKDLYQQRLDWLNDTFTAVYAPYLRVVCAFVSL
jgi:ERCC4-related helicase